MSVKEDVDRGLEIKAEFARLQDELKEIEDRLEKAGLDGKQIPLKDKDREGRQYLAQGSARIVPVVFTSDSLISSFPDTGITYLNLRGIVGDCLGEFYKLLWARRIEDGMKFRKRAHEILGDSAPHFITACLSRDKEGVPKSSVVVDWKNARPQEGAA